MIFSVIVPFLNEGKYIKECIDSLLFQDFDKDQYELIFVDNGSIDSSADAVRQFKKIILLREEKKNPYTARNRALEIARGDMIAFTDADCEVGRNWLSEIYQGMSVDGADIALGKVTFSNKNSRGLKYLEDHLQAKIEYVLSLGEIRYYYGYTNNMAVRAQVFRKLGRLKEWPVPGDTEIIHRYFSSFMPAKIVFLPKMQVAHLEVTKPIVWFKKTFIYGKHNVLVEQGSAYRPLGFRHRCRISSYCAKKYNYSLAQNLCSFIIRCWGLVCYDTGRLIGKIVFFRFLRVSPRK